MSAIEKDNLASILQQLHVDQEKSFNDLYWGQFIPEIWNYLWFIQCLEEIPNLKELYLSGIGIISIPISQEVCLLYTFIVCSFILISLI